MKNKLKELNVELIGEQNKPLTKEEEVSISLFIKQSKERRNKAGKRKASNLEKQLA